MIRRKAETFEPVTIFASAPDRSGLRIEVGSGATVPSPWFSGQGQLDNTLTGCSPEGHEANDPDHVPCMLQANVLA